MHIGSMEFVTQHLFVLDLDTGKFLARGMTFTLGLYKILGQILVYTANNKQRGPDMDQLELYIDAAANKI